MGIPVASEMNGGAFHSPCVAVVVEIAEDGTQHVIADYHPSQ